MEVFGRVFQNIGKEFTEDLRSLEENGCVYSQFWREGLDEFRFCRIQLDPDEIVGYVDSLSAYDEFLGLRQDGFSQETALAQISNKRIQNRVKEYNRWAREQDSAVEFCAAAFHGGDLESLLCGGEPDRYEYFQESYTSDRRFLLREIIAGLSESITFLQDREGERPPYEITCEQDIRDLLYAIIKPIFPDARLEEYTPKHGGRSKRIDLVIPDISTVIETKYVRNRSHAKGIGDELKVDFESYHEHSHCARLIAVVWDQDALLPDQTNFESDLAGSRDKDGSRFQVEMNVLP